MSHTITYHKTKRTDDKFWYSLPEKLAEMIVLADSLSFS